MVARDGVQTKGVSDVRERGSGAAWLTRIRHITMVHANTLLGNPIQVWSVVNAVTITTNCLGRMVITEHEGEQGTAGPMGMAASCADFLDSAPAFNPAARSTP